MDTVRLPLSLILACAMAVSMGSDRLPLRSPAAPHSGTSLARRLDGRYMSAPTRRQMLQLPAVYVQDHPLQRSLRLFAAHKQKRSCNTATCVTLRLANFLSRSGGVGSSSFVPTDVGARAFGRRRRAIGM